MSAAVAYVRQLPRTLWQRLTTQKPHFNFITVHYAWIVGATLLSSILIYGGGKGNVAFIDALMFGSGANTQAGLNPVDVNLLNTFQQIIMYIFAITSNPITLHGSVVILRLYWFEKRFQGWVKDARSRRRTISKSKSKYKDDITMAEQGVNGRPISIVPQLGRGPRIANDGILLDKEEDHQEGKTSSNSEESDSTASTGEQKQNSESVKVEEDGRAKKGEAVERASNDWAILDDDDDEDLRGTEQSAKAGETNAEHPLSMAETEPMPRKQTRSGSHTAITFADTVKRSDGLGDDNTKFPAPRSNAEHIAILERQREEDDDEVLRIPGPRDAERGLGPRRLQQDEPEEDDEHAIGRIRTFESRPTVDSRTIQDRQPTITITEPEHHRRNHLMNDAKAIGGTLNSLGMRKPRIMNHRQSKLHEDGAESVDGSRSVRGLRPLETIRSALTRDKALDDMPYLSYTATLGRNSQFIGLSLEQREELGGIEYRSLRTLAFFLMFYYWGVMTFGLLCLLPWILRSRKYGEIVNDDGINKTWWAFYTANSAFNDVGFTLTPDSMNSFNRASFIMVIMWFLILAGNTAFPVLLRFFIWVSSKLVPKGTGLWEELRFLLDHPRRCFTLLFPSAANWWLFWILVLLNAIDLIFFIILDLGSGPVSTFPVHIRVVDGLFQAASTRTAGFSCVNISQLHPAVPVSYIIMMYISVFPIAISIRRTNVYEEKSLGVYNKRDEDDNAAETSAVSYVGTHLRRQLSFDLWFVFLGFFILAITEGPKIQNGDFGMFEVLFEVVSAYGTVGMSFGWSGGNESLSSQFTTLGKLIIVALEIRGRHRGLPYGLDRAVLLPSESRFERETQEASGGTMARTNTHLSGAATTGAEVLSPSISRGRSRSRDRGRTNNNLVAQFLQPGPAVSEKRHIRALSADADDHYSLRQRRTGASTLSDQEEATELQPLPSVSRPFSRRTETSITS